MPTPLSELMRACQVTQGACRAEVTDDWLQGRSVFGGLQVALAVQAMRDLVPDMPLRTLQVLFASPVPGGSVTSQARILRQGKSTVHAEARLLNGEETLTLVVGVFGAARKSAASVRHAPPVQVNGESLPFNHIPNVTPAFVQHFKSRWLAGPLPFAGIKDTEIVVETSIQDSGPCSEAHVISIADRIPPIALSHFTTPAPGSSMTWMLDFMTDRFERFALEGWRIEAKMHFAEDGYSTQSAVIWAPDGTPVALSRQSMVVFG